MGLRVFNLFAWVRGLVHMSHPLAVSCCPSLPHSLPPSVVCLPPTHPLTLLPSVCGRRMMMMAYLLRPPGSSPGDHRSRRNSAGEWIGLEPASDRMGGRWGCSGRCAMCGVIFGGRTLRFEGGGGWAGVGGCDSGDEQGEAVTT